ncbi:hypothetical protein ABEH87_16750 [Erwinia sp. Eh17-17]|uniref:hypothetical protein n=1 Tax=Erwinia sp. Eh17-17 TaxID=3080330 RepID=UPI00320AB5FF
MIFRVMIILLGAFSSIVWAEGCNSNDATIFSCRMNNSSFYVCSGGDKAYYKHFKKGVNDFIYPNNHSPGVFSLSSTGYSGGGETRIEFHQNEYLYSIYDKIVKTEDNGETYPDFESGIEVIKNNVVISKKECLSSSGVNQALAEKSFNPISR